MPDKKIKAVLFDLGETLLTFGKINIGELFREGARLSYNYLVSMNQPVGSFGWYRRRSLFSLRARSLLSAVTGNDFNALSVMKGIGEKLNVRLSEEQWQHFGWMWYEPLSKTAKMEPDIIRTLQKLRDMGLKLGIVSNTFVSKTSLEKHLERLGILEFFTVRIYSYQYDFRKPNIKIFKIAAEKAGEAAENILFVGDRINKDIKPAIKAEEIP